MHLHTKPGCNIFIAFGLLSNVLMPSVEHSKIYHIENQSHDKANYLHLNSKEDLILVDFSHHAKVPFIQNDHASNTLCFELYLIGKYLCQMNFILPHV